MVIWLFALVLVGAAAAQAHNGTLRMLWITPTPLDDFGFSFSVDRARLKLEQVLDREGMLTLEGGRKGWMERR